MGPALLLLLSAGLAVAAGPGRGEVKTVERKSVLEDKHGYFPCSDCHADQETNPKPRFLEEEHETPLEWEDDAGETHVVEFGEKVAIGDLLGHGGQSGNRRRNLIKVGERLEIAQYMEAQELGEADSVYVLTHGGANLWCLDCHNADDRDYLRKLNGEKLSFDDSEYLCGQCHGPIFIDWEHGVHGRTNGNRNRDLDHDDATRRLLCIQCHIPHAPRFRGVMPEAAPVARLDPIAEPAEDAKSHHRQRGEYDRLGPHPWVKSGSAEHADEFAHEEGGAH
jgi:hypothetical protein